MTWFKVDDTLHSHKKAMRAGAEAMGLWVLAGSWAADQLTDGWVPDYAITRWSSHPDELANRLVAAGLWVEGEHDGDKGWWFHEWEERQPTRSDVLVRRKADAERRARWREEKKRRPKVDSPTDASHRDTETSHRDASPGDSQSDTPRESRVSDDVTTADLGFLFGDDEKSHRDTPRESQGVSHPASALPDPTRPDPKDKAGRKRRPARPLPDDWKPNENHAYFARENNLDLAHEADQFRAHAEANERRQANWDAAFRQWLGNATRWSRPRLKAVGETHRADPSNGVYWEQ